jgi:tRNA-2-methylthio-N6-dimethylallyladenosine synthase
MSMDSPKTYSIKNYGCQMNVYDGERMAEMFESQGMSPADDKANADLVVLNTCHIREKAAEKVYSEIGRLRRKDGTSPVIAVAGCSVAAQFMLTYAPSCRAHLKHNPSRRSSLLSNLQAVRIAPTATRCSPRSPSCRA